MSRSALWRQEVNVVERQRKAEETLQLAVEEGKSRSQKGLVRVTNDNHFNINPMLLQNISKSPYFQKCCNNLHDWNALVDEIYYEVKTLEPWSNGT
jgi:pre-mRNA-splicing factor 38B